MAPGNQTVAMWSWALPTMTATQDDLGYTIDRSDRRMHQSPVTSHQSQGF
eukprot:gene2706-1967_t